MKLIIALITIAIFILLLRSVRRKKVTAPNLPEAKEHDLLMQHVRFYAALGADDQAAFRARMQQFLEKTAITPVGEVTITDLDKLYLAAAAIIPIFAYKDWMYDNLDEVLIYPGAFTKDFMGRPEDSNVLGMVGEGAMNRIMIMSISALRAGFEQSGTGNTAIHEFVHLLDKADGSTDGIPEMIMPEALRPAWLEYMHRAIQEIRAGQSDINPYGATNDTEFFAVVSEYFFQQPEMLKEKHPEIWEMLETIYKAKTATPAS